ncbi:phosphocholine cytidylyltransferase family protein [Flavicella sp.]|uniref:phosphocholine cytidylyltransferase family protein n=1 Tax=Flavicella sp. TaxID=2957742 RepID=UPI0030172A93
MTEIYNLKNSEGSEKITTALILAAGTGSRLSPLTNEAPKCLTVVNEIEILGRLVETLHYYKFKRLVIVIGPFEQQIRDYLKRVSKDIIVEYIISPVYKTTNNIYSLWLAREKMKESFVLIESDLIFKPSLLEEMLSPNRMAVSHMLPWMNGTTITIDKQLPRKVAAINLGEHVINETNFKTVNIYSFSLESWKQVGNQLGSWISKGKVNGYYEAVFSEMVADGSLSFDCVYFDNDFWYEIDTIADLHECEKNMLFTKQPLSTVV